MFNTWQYGNKLQISLENLNTITIIYKVIQPLSIIPNTNYKDLHKIENKLLLKKVQTLC